jgi:hypothetical protein
MKSREVFYVLKKVTARGSIDVLIALYFHGKQLDAAAARVEIGLKKRERTYSINTVSP